MTLVNFNNILLFNQVYLAERLEDDKLFAVKAFAKEAAYSQEKGKVILHFIFNYNASSIKIILRSNIYYILSQHSITLFTFLNICIIYFYSNL